MASYKTSEIYTYEVLTNPELRKRKNILNSIKELILQGNGFKGIIQMLKSWILNHNHTSILNRLNILKAGIPLLAAILVILFAPMILNIHINNRIRFKNSEAESDQPTLIVYKKDPMGITKVEEGEIINGNTLLQIAYKAPRQKYGIIFSLDDNHTISYLLASDTSGPVELNKKEDNIEVLLPFSFNLENTMKYEMLILVSSNNLDSLIAVINNISTQRKKGLVDDKMNDDVFIKTFTLKKGGNDVE